MPKNKSSTPEVADYSIVEFMRLQRFFSIRGQPAMMLSSGSQLERNVIQKSMGCEAAKGVQC